MTMEEHIPWRNGNTCTQLSAAWHWWEAELPALLAGALQRALPWHADLAALPEPAVATQNLGTEGIVPRGVGAGRVEAHG